MTSLLSPFILEKYKAARAKVYQRVSYDLDAVCQFEDEENPVLNLAQVLAVYARFRSPPPITIHPDHTNQGHVLTVIGDSTHRFYCFISHKACLEYQKYTGQPLCSASENEYIQIRLSGMILIKEAKLDVIAKNEQVVPSLRPYIATREELSEIRKDTIHFVPVFEADRCIFIMPASRSLIPSPMRAKKLIRIEDVSLSPTEDERNYRGVTGPLEGQQQLIKPDGFIKSAQKKFGRISTKVTLTQEFDASAVYKPATATQIPILVPSQNRTPVNIPIYSFKSTSEEEEEEEEEEAQKILSTQSIASSDQNSQNGNVSPSQPRSILRSFISGFLNPFRKSTSERNTSAGEEREVEVGAGVEAGAGAEAEVEVKGAVEDPELLSVQAQPEIDPELLSVQAQPEVGPELQPEPSDHPLETEIEPSNKALLNQNEIIIPLSKEPLPIAALQKVQTPNMQRINAQIHPPTPASNIYTGSQLLNGVISPIPLPPGTLVSTTAGSEIEPRLLNDTSDVFDNTQGDTDSGDSDIQIVSVSDANSVRLEVAESPEIARHRERQIDDGEVIPNTPSTAETPLGTEKTSSQDSITNTSVLGKRIASSSVIDNRDAKRRQAEIITVESDEEDAEYFQAFF